MNDTINPSTGEVVTGMPPAIASAIVAVKKQIKQIGFDEKNQHGGYNYVSVDRMYERLGPMLAERGLALLIDETDTSITVNETTDRDGKVRKTPWLFAQYSLAFMHESGAVSAPMRRSLAMPINGPQTYGAAQSYVEKQFLRQVFKVPTGEKDADEVAQGDDTPARGRQTQLGANGSRSVPRRQEAAPPPSSEKAEIMKRFREIRNDIDREEDPKILRTVDEWPAFQTLDRLYREAAAKEEADAGMQMLLNRARERVEQLVGSLEPFDGR